MGILYVRGVQREFEDLLAVLICEFCAYSLHSFATPFLTAKSVASNSAKPNLVSLLLHMRIGERIIMIAAKGNARIGAHQ